MSLLELIMILIMVESGGNNLAVGDNGLALGCLQIHQCVIDDVNRIYGTSYVHEDAYDRDKSIDICYKYLSYWGTEKRLGRKPTLMDMSLIWNGGPNGWKRGPTDPYWLKVKALIHSSSNK